MLQFGHLVENLGRVCKSMANMEWEEKEEHLYEFVRLPENIRQVGEQTGNIRSVKKPDHQFMDAGGQFFCLRYISYLFRFPVLSDPLISSW